MYPGKGQRTSWKRLLSSEAQMYPLPSTSREVGWRQEGRGGREGKYQSSSNILCGAHAVPFLFLTDTTLSELCQYLFTFTILNTRSLVGLDSTFVSLLVKFACVHSCSQ